MEQQVLGPDKCSGPVGGGTLLSFFTHDAPPLGTSPHSQNTDPREAASLLRRKRSFGTARPALGYGPVSCITRHISSGHSKVKSFHSRARHVVEVIILGHRMSECSNLGYVDAHRRESLGATSLGSWGSAPVGAGVADSGRGAARPQLSTHH